MPDGTSLQPPRDLLVGTRFNMLNSGTQKREQGFSLFELLIVLGVILVVAAITVPFVMNIVAGVNLRYAATNLGGRVRSARAQAIRTNTLYSVQPVTLSSGSLAYYIDRPGVAYTAGDPLLPTNQNIAVFQGTGSSAPNEATFVTGLTFAIDPGADNPSFNARGFPCIYAAGACPQAGVQGFVLLLSNSSITGGLNWAALAITPSGRVEVWTCDGSGNWLQRS